MNLSWTDLDPRLRGQAGLQRRFAHIQRTVEPLRPLNYRTADGYIAGYHFPSLEPVYSPVPLTGRQAVVRRRRLVRRIFSLTKAADFV